MATRKDEVESKITTELKEKSNINESTNEANKDQTVKLLELTKKFKQCYMITPESGRLPQTRKVLFCSDNRKSNEKNKNGKAQYIIRDFDPPSN